MPVKGTIKFLSLVLLLTAILLPGSHMVAAADPQYDVKIVDYISPEGEIAYSTSIVGINSRGDVVGQFNWSAPYLPPSYLPNFHGFLLSEGKWTVLDAPDSISTAVTGIGPSGTVVGYYFDQGNKSHGFKWTKEDGFSTVDHPDFLQTQINGIGPDGKMYGVAWNAVQGTAWVDSHSFVIAPNGMPMDADEMSFTAFTRATPNGKTMAGIYRTTSGNPPIGPPPNRACVIEDGVRSPLTLAGLGQVGYSSAWGVSPSGNIIVGQFGDVSSAYNWAGRSFIGERKGKNKEFQFHEFILPEPTIVAARIFDINAGGVLVGGCNHAKTADPASYAWHGFIATPLD